MHIQYSTKQVAAHERLAFWEDMICATYASLQSSARDNSEIYGSISALNLGQVQISTVQTTIAQVTRPARFIAKDKQAYLLVHLARAGKARVEHRSRNVTLAPGDMTAYITSEPYQLQFQGWSNTQVIKLPLAAVSSLLPGLEDLVARRVPADTAELRVLSALLVTVSNLHADLDAGSHIGIAEALRQSVAAALGTLRHDAQDHPSKLEQFYLSNAKAFINSQLRSPTLTVQDIATHVGICARHLSRLFATHVMPIHRYVQEARLKGCAAELLRRRGTRGAIHVVAYEWGFSSPSHFSRVFRSVLGISPTEWLTVQPSRVGELAPSLTLEEKIVIAD